MSQTGSDRVACPELYPSEPGFTGLQRSEPARDPRPCNSWGDALSCTTGLN